MFGPERGQLPNASSGMRYILIRASRYKMYRPPAECVGKLTPFRPYVHVLQAPFSNMF